MRFLVTSRCLYEGVSQAFEEDQRAPSQESIHACRTTTHQSVGVLTDPAVRGLGRLPVPAAALRLAWERASRSDHVNPAGFYIKESDRSRTSLNNSSRCLSSKTNCCFTQPRSGCFSTCSHMTCHRRSLMRSAEARLRSLHCCSYVTAATCRYMPQACL